MHPISSLFLSQSYQDAWADYSRSLVSPQFVHWDYIILTASNERQAEGFQAQLKERRQAGLLPLQTQFAVIPDPEGKRVGSDPSLAQLRLNVFVLILNFNDRLNPASCIGISFF